MRRRRLIEATVFRSLINVLIMSRKAPITCIAFRLAAALGRALT